ncbi:hypothetical protein Caci_4489 [Catenulispora acidiphila DSM 44928]|uniref:Uncharacterized protein n=1 Tax=Catenulispora acidiphila (strain DSM 44928 / JCM 14897 / NBRC 102108 / NRRL B-24433 / ID139908) TaxID=479433 RepID=C7PWA4_CATAD|nr:hypothetical protein Caci_4489 [Catenulispora acidiphila DSM 44928]
MGMVAARRRVVGGEVATGTLWLVPGRELAAATS